MDSDTHTVHVSDLNIRDTRGVLQMGVERERHVLAGAGHPMLLGAVGDSLASCSHPLPGELLGNGFRLSHKFRLYGEKDVFSLVCPENRLIASYFYLSCSVILDVSDIISS